VCSPAETLEAVIDMLKTASKSRWRVAVQVIRAIGYPHNKPAISELIAQIGDLNSPAWREVAQTLMEMGSQVVVPYLIEALLDKGKNLNYWPDEVAGICSLLTITPREYAVQCGPIINYLLGQETVFADLDPWYLLNVLKKKRGVFSST
jgi:HEAT repeat protein